MILPFLRLFEDDDYGASTKRYTKFNANWKRAAKDIHGFGEGYCFPLTKEISKILGFGYTGAALHVTGIRLFPGLVQHQGLKNRALSVTTDFGYQFQGVHATGIGCVMVGEILFDYPGDIMSIPVNNGMRWVPFTSLGFDFYYQIEPEIVDFFKNTRGPTLTVSPKDQVAFFTELIRKHAFKFKNIIREKQNYALQNDQGPYHYGEAIMDSYKIVEVHFHKSMVEEFINDAYYPKDRARNKRLVTQQDSLARHLVGRDNVFYVDSYEQALESINALNAGLSQNSI
jgi:hypothetical protein